ncbi:50S ribosomal protein L23 [archaeon]|nr:50S ribosomal protein L23 [archaeon]NCP79588.1 50S ribosomal protein L23 [archaeon]NCP98341.1 50S ribosomal protein L23 [archaeon]NCQ07355.1 50S ribosomal protein L23 [archaeon]NCQ51151.1 50S ribosomal protein L23 [archaeon]
MAKTLEYYDIVEYPVITEKAVDLISTQNKLTFIVNKKSNKAEIKAAVEKLYKVKVKTINTLVDRKSRKKAFVTLSKEFNAQDVANKLGIL